MKRLRNNVALYFLCFQSTKDVWLKNYFEHLKIAKNSKDHMTLNYDSQTTITYIMDPKYHNKEKKLISSIIL